jgi:hypothetical protein
MDSTSAFASSFLRINLKILTAIWSSTKATCSSDWRAFIKTVGVVVAATCGRAAAAKAQDYKPQD